VSTKTQPPEELTPPLLDPDVEPDEMPPDEDPLDPPLLEPMPPEELPDPLPDPLETPPEELPPEEPPGPTSLVLPPQAPEAANERRSAEARSKGTIDRVILGGGTLHAPCLGQALVMT
jgi:hypothetical protein